MARWIAMVGVWAWAVAAAGQGPATTQPRSRPSEADLLAADSLYHSASSMVHARWGVRGRAGRLMALATYARQLNPGDVRVAALLGSIYQSRYQHAAAEEAFAQCLTAEPNDYVTGANYILVALAARAKPSDRQAFLQGMMGSSNYPDALRAEAAVAQARMFMENRRPDLARRFYDRALELDPLNDEALQGVLAASATQPPLEESARTLVRMIEGNPREVSLLRNLAGLLSVVGLHDQAAPLFDIVWDQAVAQAGPDAPPADLAGQYLNALLDAKRYERAMEVFAPILMEYPDQRGIQDMMVETYLRLGQTDLARQLSRAALAPLEETLATTQPTVGQAADLAWAYTIYDPNPERALYYARQAAEAPSNAPILQRLVGAAELLSDDPNVVAAGRERLEEIQDQDRAAAALLARHYLALGDTQAAAAVIPLAVEKNHSDWSYRLARDVAEEAGVTMPPHPSAEACLAVFQQFDRECLRMGEHPEEYLSVTLRGVGDSWRVGEGLEIEAVLKNIGDRTVPLGPRGLIQARISLAATATARSDTERFAELPMLVWPAPKYLPPGASVRQTVRLDVGALAHFLVRHPLDDVTLTVTGMLDPIQQGREIVSAVPSLTVPPLTITRQGLLGDVEEDNPSAWVKAYRYALRVVMTDLVRGDLPRRMRATRQIGELVTLVRDVQLFKTRLPDPLKGVVRKNVLLAMVQKALEDPSPVVRAEMLAAMDNAELDESILAIVTPLAKDPSPLVRFRLVELLGGAGRGKAAETIDALADDEDPHVRRMVAAFAASTSSD